VVERKWRTVVSVPFEEGHSDNVPETERIGRTLGRARKQSRKYDKALRPVVNLSRLGRNGRPVHATIRTIVS